jgi:hypothetical protein
VPTSGLRYSLLRRHSDARAQRARLLEHGCHEPDVVRFLGCRVEELAGALDIGGRAARDERARVPSRVDVVDSVEAVSFAHGFFAPRTFAGRGWIDWNVGNPILLKPEQLLRRAR